MKTHKILIAILLVILAIGAVSASDEFTSDDLSVDLDDSSLQESTIDEDVAGIEEGNDDVVGAEENGDDELSKEVDADDVIAAKENNDVVSKEAIGITDMGNNYFYEPDAEIGDNSGTVYTDPNSSNYGKQTLVDLECIKNLKGTLSIYTDSNVVLFNKKISDITKNVKIVKDKKKIKIFISDVKNVDKLKNGDILNVDFKEGGPGVDIDGNYFVTFAQYKVTVKDKYIVLKRLKEVLPYVTEKDDARILPYGKSNTVKICLKDEDTGKKLSGKTITFKFHGKKYKKVTDSKGFIYFKTPANLKPGKYKFNALFIGDGKYGKGFERIEFKISKATPKLTAAKKTFKAKSAKKITATLKTNTGKVMKNKKVTLKVNGKKFVKKTNSKGKVTFKVTKSLSKKGTYKAKIKFAGNKYYKAKTKTVKITVK